ncbi:MAG: class I SAM-dependent methyltransferase, partial [Anaerolineales bacterium]|nr:class I SAM-dependent methyltransferase [Anaerolineales bacterium]
MTKRKYAKYTQARQEHWDGMARRRDHRHGWDKYYHRRLSEIYQFLVSPGRRVLELGCGEGDLLDAVKPSVGFGVDFSSEMLKLAVKKYPAFNFIQADIHEVDLNHDFDVIILSDILNDVWDVQAILKRMKCFTKPRTRIIINSFSHLWQIPLTVARWLGLATQNLPQNWLTVEDIANLLQLTGYEVIRTWPEIIWPLPTPLVDK